MRVTLGFMRIALFGGSFDPPHHGHLAVAREAIERLQLDEVWMAPVGAQPLKLGAAATSYEDRLAMVRLAVAGIPGIVASTVDAPRNDGRPNFTIDVLATLRAAMPPDDELLFLLGADAFLALKHWHCADDLLFLCDFIVAGRPGFSTDDAHHALPPGIDAERVVKPGAVAWTLRDEAGRRSNLYLLPDLQVDVSATDIRSAIAGDKSAEGVLTPAVRRYIEQNGLYR